jgi:DNA-binding transcriptional LysR family regulator
MDWKSISFDWNRARAFLVTAEEGSLSAAARALAMTQPTLGRQVSALESQLGVVLFDRVGGRLVLTSNGLDLLQHVKVMADAANQVSLTATQRADSIDGDVCISASEIHATYLLPQIISKLRTVQPGINIKVVSSNEASDLLRREADIAIRSFRPTQAELISKKIKDVDAPFYAAKSYIKQFGAPTNQGNLTHAQFLAIGDKSVFLKQMNERGFSITEENLCVESQSHIVHWELVKQGLGIGIVPANIGDREPLVERVLRNAEPISFSIWLTSHRELRASKRIRFVFDSLANELSKPD